MRAFASRLFSPARSSSERVGGARDEIAFGVAGAPPLTALSHRPHPSLLSLPAPAQPTLLLFSGGGGGGGAPVTVAGGAGGGIISLDDLRAVVRAEVRSPVESVSISKATPAVMSGLLETAGIFETSYESVGAVPADFLPALRAFDWQRGEHKSTADACARLSEYLAAAGAPMAPAAVPGFKVVDVHTRSVLTTQLGRIQLKGGTDAIVVPSTQADEFASLQARVVVDFKVDASVFVDVLGQAEAELVAASSLSHHDVMVVFTDLNQHGHVLRAEGGRLLVWKNLSVRETVFLVADFLSAQCAKVGVPNLDDDRVPGAPDAKKRRIALSVALHGMRPTNEALMDQLEAFHGGAGVDEYLQGRALVLGALGIEGYEGGWTPSYFS